ncbi:Hypothetical predicted protein [Octopus vulgaris]|uniref:Uncharacterized protein n=1 Tax=Octopus vulgaris TaxID=6645 RepID=A0AA36F1E1_OCTVU|nr:Hypothetical predicted protein [Octopus vulgaris]
MDRKCDLTASVKSVITSGFAKGQSTLEISKILGRYHQILEKNVTAIYEDIFTIKDSYFLPLKLSYPLLKLHFLYFSLPYFSQCKRLDENYSAV